jgi:hypothetical protein
MLSEIPIATKTLISVLLPWLLNGISRFVPRKHHATEPGGRRMTQEYVPGVVAINVSLGLCFKIRVARRKTVSLNLPSFSLFLSIASGNAG